MDTKGSTFATVASGAVVDQSKEDTPRCATAMSASVDTVVGG
jgi:hypothetical protein